MSSSVIEADRVAIRAVRPSPSGRPSPGPGGGSELAWILRRNRPMLEGLFRHDLRVRLGSARPTPSRPA